MDYKVDINKDKWFDVRKTTEVFEALKQEAETYCKNSDATGLAYQSFVASEAFMGQSADATKNFVGNGMGKMNSYIKEAVLKCLKNQEDLLTGFSEMVDSSPNAYIDYNTLKVIDQDLDGYYTNFKSIAQSVDEIINKLNNEFGKDLGEFPKPDKGGVQNAFNDMCGAESGGGYIKECQDKFISFDNAMSNHVRANDTAAFRDDITGKVDNATNVFSAGGAMPMPARFNDLKIKKFLNPDQNSDSATIEQNFLYDREENYCDDSDDARMSYRGIPDALHDEDDDLDEYLKARCDLDRINNADDNRVAKDNTFDHNADDNRDAKDNIFDHNAANSILYPSMQIISSNPIIGIFSSFVQSFADETEHLSRDWVGINAEDLMRMSFAPWSLFAKPKGTDVTDPFDDHGLYGGDQGNIDPSTNVFWTGWIIGEDDEIYDFVKKYEGYENYSDKQIHDLLNTLEDDGCTYVAAANAIFWHYRNQGELFEKKFGFPIKGKDGDLNYKKLIIDLYLNCSYKIYLDGPNGLSIFNQYYIFHPDEFKARFKDYCVKDENGNFIGELDQIIDQAGKDLIAKGETEINTIEDFTIDEAFKNRFERYYKEKKIGLVITGGYEQDMNSIRDALDNGDIVEAGASNFKFQFEDGSYKNFGMEISNHAITITGIAPDGRYIVSSWGTKYYLDPKDAENFCVHIIKYDPSKMIKMNVEDMDEERTASVEAKLSGDIKHKDFRPEKATVTKLPKYDVPLK